MPPTSLPITLKFKAKNLANKDLLSKSDPLLVVYQLLPIQKCFNFKPEKGNFKTQEIFRTERIKNELNPEWENTMTMEYKFEEEQWIFIQILDIDAKHSTNVKDQDFLGGVITTVGRIINGQKDGWFDAALQNANQMPILVKGTTSLVCVKTTVMPRVSSNYKIRCEFTLKSTKIFGSDTPYFTITNQNGQSIYESKKGNGKVTKYDAFALPGMHAVNTTWTFAHTHEKDGRIGTVTIAESYMQTLPSGTSMLVVDDKGVTRGTLTFVEIAQSETKEEIKESIVHQLNNGLNISAVVAIDFTGSNGDPREPHSLHYLNGTNAYRKALLSILAIIDQYDKDGSYPVFGFGMSYNKGPTDHAKLLVADAKYSDGAIMAYESAVRSSGFELSGPTNFSPIINTVVANLGNAKQSYTVLVIFTNGAITDMDATIEAIVSASYKPISLIIVGIGDADFGAMNKLDNDGKPPLKDYRGRSAMRDIVQFVPMNECLTGAKLQSATLAELPGQIMEYERKGFSLSNPV